MKIYANNRNWATRAVKREDRNTPLDKYLGKDYWVKAKILLYQTWRVTVYAKILVKACEDSLEYYRMYYIPDWAIDKDMFPLHFGSRDLNDFKDTIINEGIESALRYYDTCLSFEKKEIYLADPEECLSTDELIDLIKKRFNLK